MSDPAPATTTEQTLWTGTVSNLHYAGKWILVVILLAAVVTSFWLVLPDLGLMLWAARAALVVIALLLIAGFKLTGCDAGMWSQTSESASNTASSTGFRTKSASL